MKDDRLHLIPVTGASDLPPFEPAYHLTADIAHAQVPFIPHIDLEGVVDADL